MTCATAPSLSTVVTAVPPGTGGGRVADQRQDPLQPPDGQYDGWGLHVWQIDDAGQFIADYPGVVFSNHCLPAGFDDYGPVFPDRGAEVHPPASRGLRLHRPPRRHQGSRRRSAVEVHRRGEFWLRSADPAIYRSNPLAGALDLATVRVHYKRFDASYAVWGLHLWATSGIDVARLPGLAIDNFGAPVPLSAMPGFTAYPTAPRSRSMSRS